MTREQFDALNAVLEAARIRLSQWSGIACGDDPEEVVEELWEVYGKRDGMQEATERERALEASIAIVDDMVNAEIQAACDALGTPIAKAVSDAS